MKYKDVNPSDHLADVTSEGLMSGGLPSTSLKDIRRERERMSVYDHPVGQGDSCPYMPSKSESEWRQRDAGNRPPKR